jgi:hypothetical protein
MRYSAIGPNGPLKQIWLDRRNWWYAGGRWNGGRETKYSPLAVLPTYAALFSIRWAPAENLEISTCARLTERNGHHYLVYSYRREVQLMGRSIDHDTIFVDARTGLLTRQEIVRHNSDRPEVVSQIQVTPSVSIRRRRSSCPRIYWRAGIKLVEYSNAFSDDEIADIVSRWRLRKSKHEWVSGLPEREIPGVANEDGFWVSVTPSRDGSALWFAGAGLFGTGAACQDYPWSSLAGGKPKSEQWYRETMQALGPSCMLWVTNVSVAPEPPDDMASIAATMAEGVAAWSRLGALTMARAVTMTPVVSVKSSWRRAARRMPHTRIVAT